MLYEGDSGFKYAVEDLYEEHEPEEENELIEFVLANRASGLRDAAEAVCMCALARNDVALWQQAVAACVDGAGAGVKVIDDEIWARALEKWGWESVRPRCVSVR